MHKKSSNNSLVSNSSGMNNNSSFLIKNEQRHNFSLYNTLKENKGKEFAIRITPEMRRTCWKKYSGGTNRSIELDDKVYEMMKSENKEEESNIKGLNDYLDSNSNNLLQLSLLRKDDKFIRYFIGKKIDINHRNNLGRTSMHFAMQNKDEEIIDLLLSNGGDVNVKDNKGKTPYDMATRDIRYNLQLGRYLKEE